MVWPNKKIQPFQKMLRVFRPADFERYTHRIRKKTGHNFLMRNNGGCSS